VARARGAKRLKRKPVSAAIPIGDLGVGELLVVAGGTTLWPPGTAAAKDVSHARDGYADIRSLLEGGTVGDHEGRIDLALLDAFEQQRQVALDRRLGHAEGEAAVDMRKVRPRLMADPMGMLSRKPP
jgi:hypothetical protein